MPGPLYSILTASQVLCWEREEPEARDKRFCVVLGPPSLVFLMILFLTVKLWASEQGHSSLLVPVLPVCGVVPRGAGSRLS